jgi:DNA primase
MFCKWHPDEVTPNLVIYPDHAYCFACNKYADAIEVIQTVYGYSFEEAVRFLVRHQNTANYRKYLPSAIDPEMVRAMQNKLIELPEDSPQWEFLLGRGLAYPTIHMFAVGCTDTEISIPHMVQGEVRNVKYRLLPGVSEDLPRYRSMSGRPLTDLYPHDHILRYAEESNILILTEGEFDAMLLRQSLLPAASMPHGVNGRLAQWYSDFSMFQQVWVAFDQDPAGDEAWERFQTKRNTMGQTDEEMLAPTKFVRLRWPSEWGKDITDARELLIPKIQDAYAKTTRGV